MASADPDDVKSYFDLDAQSIIEPLPPASDEQSSTDDNLASLLRIASAMTSATTETEKQPAKPEPLEPFASAFATFRDTVEVDKDYPTLASVEASFQEAQHQQQNVGMDAGYHGSGGFWPHNSQIWPNSTWSADHQHQWQGNFHNFSVEPLNQPSWNQTQGGQPNYAWQGSEQWHGGYFGGYGYPMNSQCNNTMWGPIDYQNGWNQQNWNYPTNDPGYVPQAAAPMPQEWNQIQPANNESQNSAPIERAKQQLPAAVSAAPTQEFDENMNIITEEEFRLYFKRRRVELGYTQKQAARAISADVGEKITKPMVAFFEDKGKGMFRKPAFEKWIRTAQKNTVTDGQSGKPRIEKSKSQKLALNRFFKSNPRPSKEEKAELADELGLTLRDVSLWFKKKRQGQVKNGNRK